MKKIGWINTLIASVLLSTPAFAEDSAAILTAPPGQETHGGDAFDTGVSAGADIKFWDMMEFGESFQPLELPEGKIVREQFAALEAKAPQTISELKKIYFQSLWSFVDPQLKDTPPVGGMDDTSLILTYQKVQAAIANPVKMTVQINRNIWNKLPERARAFLLVHELLWLAEKSPLWYQRFNQRIALRHIEKPAEGPTQIELFEGTWLDPTFTINANDISTTSADIRRLAGFLLNADNARLSEVKGTDILAYIMNAAGRVHANTQALNKITAYNSRNEKGDLSDAVKFKPAGNAVVPQPGWFNVMLVKENPIPRGWVTRFSICYHDDLPWSSDGENWNLASYKDEASDCRLIKNGYAEKRLLRIEVSDLTPLGLVARQEYTALKAKEIAEKNDIDRTQKQEALNIIKAQQAASLDHLPTGINRILEGYTLMRNSFAFRVEPPRSNDWNVIDVDPEAGKSHIRTYALAYKLDGTSKVTIRTVRVEQDNGTGNFVYSISGKATTHRWKDLLKDVEDFSFSSSTEIMGAKINDQPSFAFILLDTKSGDLRTTNYIYWPADFVVMP